LSDLRVRDVLSRVRIFVVSSPPLEAGLSVMALLASCSLRLSTSFFSFILSLRSSEEASPPPEACEAGGRSQRRLLWVYVNPTNGRWTVSAVTLFRAYGSVVCGRPRESLSSSSSKFLVSVGLEYSGIYGAWVCRMLSHSTPEKKGCGLKSVTPFQPSLEPGSQISLLMRSLASFDTSDILTSINLKRVYSITDTHKLSLPFSYTPHGSGVRAYTIGVGGE
jgi:hypothetical protein